MENVSENIFKYYMKELSLFRLAFGSRAAFVKTIFIICVIFGGIYYSTNFSNYKVVFLVGFLLCMGLFFEFIRYKIIKRHKDISDKYNISQSKMIISKIITIKLVEFVYSKGLFNKDGLEYLINIYSKKSTKNRFQGIAIGVVLLSAVTQTIVDFLIMSEQKDWERLNSYLNYFKANSTFILTIIIATIIMFFLMRYSYYEALSLFINRKSNNYQQIADYLEGRILPLVLKFSFFENRDILYKHMTDSLKDNSVQYKNMDDKSHTKKIKIRIIKSGNRYYVKEPYL